MLCGIEMEDMLTYITVVFSVVIIVAYLFAGKSKPVPVPNSTEKPRARPRTPKFNVDQLEQRIRRRLMKENR